MDVLIHGCGVTARFLPDHTTLIRLKIMVFFCNHRPWERLWGVLRTLGGLGIKPGNGLAVLVVFYVPSEL